MPDFKGRKDFPEVDDKKIKIGDYSGTNRLSVVDIYSPKGEPELRDQMMESVKGKPNNYDSPILSQQPTIVLSDVESEEASLIKAIDGYVGKQFGEGGGPGVANMKPIHRQMGRGATRYVPERYVHGDVTATSPSGRETVIPTEDLPGAIKPREDDEAVEIGKAEEKETPTNIGEGHQSSMQEGTHSETGERFLFPPSAPSSDVKTRKIQKSDDLEEGSRSWSYQG